MTSTQLLKAVRPQMMRKKRTAAEIAMRMLKKAGVQSPTIQTQQHDNPSPLLLREREVLTFGQLEDQRWSISPSVAKNAMCETCPELFTALVDTKSATEMHGYRDVSSTRKLMLEEGVYSAMYHQLVPQFDIQGPAGSAQYHHVGQCHHLLNCEVLT